MQAKEAGSTRFCMGAAWRDVLHRKSNFNAILESVKEVKYARPSAPPPPTPPLPTHTRTECVCE
jgi:hypothetical protein